MTLFDTPAEAGNDVKKGLGMDATGTSFESFEDAAENALRELDPGPQDIRRARVSELRIEAGGFVGRTQFIVTLTNDLSP